MNSKPSASQIPVRTTDHTVDRTPPRASGLVFLLMLTPVAYGIARRRDEINHRKSIRQETNPNKKMETILAQVEEDIFRAAQRGNVSEVKAMLATPEGQYLKSDPRNYWYDQVVYRRHGAQMMRVFWDCGLKPKPGELDSALRRAVRSEEDAALWLLSKGARVGNRAEDGNLMRGACYFGKTKLLSELIRAGGNVNARSVRVSYETRNHHRIDRFEKGWTLLMTCTEQRQLGTMTLLLKHGADPNLRSDFETTALKLARTSQWREGESALLASGAKN